MASSSIVIKVKFGENLRRFNALTLDGKLDLDMVSLRNKIRSLFNFAPDADFMLTYIDEDGDVVTLADEDDLHDVVRQSLDPLRITVRLNTDKLGRSHARSSGSSTPLGLPQDQIPFHALNSGFNEILKSLPDTLRDPISKLSLDLASKAVSSTPGLAELMEKMKMTHLQQLQASPGSSSRSGTTENTMPASGIKDQLGSKIHGESKEAPVAMDAVVGSSNSKNKGPQLQKVTECLKHEETRRRVDLNVPYHDNDTFQNPVNAMSVEGAGDGSYAQGASYVPSAVEKTKGPAIGKKKGPGIEQKVTRAEKKKDIRSESVYGDGWTSFGFGASNPDYLKHCLEDSKKTEMGRFPWVKTKKATNDSDSSKEWYMSSNECPFSGMPVSSDPTGYLGPRVPPFKKSYNQGNGMGSIFHRGVRCDGCGVHPITGPRFKSKVKDDYDLCSICFAGIGNDADYIRMDHPVNRHPFPVPGFHDPSFRIPVPPPIHPLGMPHTFRGFGKPSRSKLDSRFILDVNVLDGTIMAPSTAFTKIWRMRNNGTITWPQGSQLLWIGGDRLSNTVSVEVEIPAAGLPVDKELDIAVDFTAPELPGRYISYWRMASPSGQKFGQRVWVLIQVDASMKDLGETSSINLNLPPVSSVMKDPEVVDANVDQDPLVDSVLCENNFIKVTESENPFVEAQPKKKEQEMNFPINDSLIIGNGMGNGAVSSTKATAGGCSGSSAVAAVTYHYHGTGDSTPVGAAGSSVSYPDVGGGVSAPPQPVLYPAVNFPEVLSVDAVVGASASATQDTSGGDLDREQTLLKELEEMGFKQVDLNKEVLRMNEYNLEQSVDHLCGVSEWDPILEELQEMGFSDNETNKKLLKKNNGSIKRVVMDLINGELP